MRVVSLCPSITRLVFDLGMGEALVGISKYCIHPEEGVAGIEKLGGTKDPHLARIKDLQPDLVLLNQEENRKEDHDALVAAGLRCHVTFPQDVPGAAQAVADIARALGRGAEAGPIVAEIEAARARAAHGRARRASLRWAYLIWRKPWMAVAGGNYVHALLAEAGGSNVFGNAAETYPAVTAEDLAAADPHRIFLSSEPFPFKHTHAEELHRATGLPLERFVLVSGELLSWHGCYTARGLDLAVDLLEDARPF